MYVCMYGNILCYVPAEVYSYEYCMYERSIPTVSMLYVPLYVCMYVLCMYVYTPTTSLAPAESVCMYVCIYAYLYVSVILYRICTCT